MLWRRRINRSCVRPKWTWFGCCLVVTLALNGATAGQLPDTVDNIKPSIVGIGTHLETRNPRIEFRGSGFAVADGHHVITNAHVLPDAAERADGEELVVMVVREGGAEGRRAEVVSQNRDHDLALLRMGGNALQPLRLGNAKAVREGEELAFTGFPIGPVLGFYPATHRATVAAITPIAIPTPQARDLDRETLRRLRHSPYKVFQLDAVAYPGSSGSPLYTLGGGEVVGVVNKIFVKETKEKVLSDPSGIAYAIPGQHVRELIAEAGLTP